MFKKIKNSTTNQIIKEYIFLNLLQKYNTGYIWNINIKVIFSIIFVN